MLFCKKKERTLRGRTRQTLSHKLYLKGLSLFNRGKYQIAIEIFDDVKNYYPESVHASRAEIRTADSHFFLMEYEEAIVIYEEFRKLHPYHQDIPYILFQIGQAYFKQVKSSDRDQSPARKALSNFQYLVENYPPSIFTKAAREKIQICRRSLAEHEFLVGSFYYKKGNYRGAAARFEVIVDKYSDTGLAPQALFHLGKAFMNLSLMDKAKAAFLQITHQYPNTEFSSKARAILKAEWNEVGATTSLWPFLKTKPKERRTQRTSDSPSGEVSVSPRAWSSVLLHLESAANRMTGPKTGDYVYPRVFRKIE
jgi:outer membrane protein assembly factor BamD